MVGKSNDPATVALRGVEIDYAGELGFDQVRLRIGHTDQAANLTNFVLPEGFPITAGLEIPSFTFDWSLSVAALNLSSRPGRF